MDSISKSATVPFSAARMYALVNDVERYPEFLPWCSHAEVHEKSRDYMKASVSLAVGGIRQSFTTANTLQEGKRIDVQLVSGPFSRLQGYWVFEAAGEDRCRVNFQMDFEYRNRLIKLALNKVFQRIGDSLVGSFIERAEALYGRD